MNDVNKKRLAVVVPAYMEAKQIEQSLCRLFDVLDTIEMEARVLVVVDGSPDDTEMRAKSISDPRLEVLSYPSNRGKGFALKTGCMPVIAESDYVCFADADLDLNPSSIPSLFAILELDQADAVVGSKVHPNSVIEYPRIRRIQSTVFRLISRLLFDLNVSDTQTGLKIFSSELLAKCIDDVESTGFAFDLELLAVARLRRFKVVEGPVELSFNFTSSTGLRAIFEVLIDIARIRRRLRRLRI
jgi:glycosyltransferase involved in cell wall biosynthesis